MKGLKQFLASVGLLLAFTSVTWAQATLSSTTLSAAITSTSTNTVRVASASGITANQTLLYVDKEAMSVSLVNGTILTVSRGMSGTVGKTHASGSTVYFGPPTYFTTNDQSGSCTSTNQTVLPLINIANGNIYNCTSSVWSLQTLQATLTAPLGVNLDLTTTSDGKPVRINSRNYTQTSGSSIGFQSKPAQTVASSGSVIGGEISPRVNNGIALSGSGSIIGLHVDSYLRGTAAGTIGGDVRALNLELVTDDAGTRVITGNVNAIRIRSAFSGTSAGSFIPIRIEKAEAQTNSLQYTAVIDLPSTVPLIWNNAPGTEPTTADGYIAVRVNGQQRYIQLYSGAPVD